MNEVMTWAEIEAAFDGEWVLIEDPETTPMIEIRSGKVVFHSKDRKEVNKRMKELDLRCFAVMFMGDQPKDLEYIL